MNLLLNRKKYAEHARGPAYMKYVHVLSQFTVNCGQADIEHASGAALESYLLQRRDLLNCGFWLSLSRSRFFLCELRIGEAQFLLTFFSVLL